MAKYTEQIISDAIQSVRDGAPIRRAAREFGVPEATLRNRIKGAGNRRASSGHLQRLSPDQERQLSDWALAQVAAGCAPTHAQVKEVAQGILLTQGDTRPLGRHWMEHFLRRNPGIKARELKMHGHLLSQSKMLDQRAAAGPLDDSTTAGGATAESSSAAAPAASDSHTTALILDHDNDNDDDDGVSSDQAPSTGRPRGLSFAASSPPTPTRLVLPPIKPEPPRPVSTTRCGASASLTAGFRFETGAMYRPRHMFDPQSPPPYGDKESSAASCSQRHDPRISRLHDFNIILKPDT